MVYTVVPATLIASMTLSCGAGHADDVRERWMRTEENSGWGHLLAVKRPVSQLRVLRIDDTVVEAFPCALNE